MPKILIEKGLNLITRLENEASKHHVKSDTHEALSWEVVGIQTRIKQLECSPENVSDSSSETDWGTNIQNIAPELAEAVREFYKEYSELK